MTDALRSFLGVDLMALINDGEKLEASASGGFTDYSFVVFPFAKAYEGFLKKFFLKTGAINEFQFKNDRWRVGRALNPQLEKDLRHSESVYDRMVEFCGTADPHGSPNGSGNLIADQLWEAWKRGRNGMFHFYPDKYKPITFQDAKEAISMIKEAMEDALLQCRIGNEK